MDFKCPPNSLSVTAVGFYYFFLTSGSTQPRLPAPNPEAPLHDCLDLLDSLHTSHPGLLDVPHTSPDLVLFTNGSSLVLDGVRQAGVAVVSVTWVLWGASLTPGTSAQRVELIALTKALQLEEGKRANIYTDNVYAFATIHVHGYVYQQRGLLTSVGKEVRNHEQIQALLYAVWLPKEVAVIHIATHTRNKDQLSLGNAAADEAAKMAALHDPIPLMQLQQAETWNSLPPRPSYSKEDPPGEDEIGWRRTSEGKLILP
ncbi:uncharacterized protein [Petaurus breviceps papuanus]|uniref:uncharacterized protein isoform X1 n=1 Tax=Petaurus breviceps papuanus TaxID=3040969 RepID=UPI0036DDE808